uniref:CHD1 helical C-terminal domain containing 1 n=1 Tax=Coturnix japonica TaxID=93934 RepID=A0A8C2YF32_COTJA
MEESRSAIPTLPLQCKEYLRPFKRSLRKLHLPQQLSRKKKLKYMKESVTIIGDRINLFLQQHCRASEVRHWKKMMWRFASLFSDKDEKQLQKLYKYIQRNKMQKFQVSKQDSSLPHPEAGSTTIFLSAKGDEFSPPQQTPHESDHKSSCIRKMLHALKTSPLLKAKLSKIKACPSLDYSTVFPAELEGTEKRQEGSQCKLCQKPPL